MLNASGAGGQGGAQLDGLGGWATHGGCRQD